MIKITSLGGSGEDSRNCFLVRSDEYNILLDCGVRREIAEVSRVYPLLTEEIAKSLDAVLISHAHEDHTAALPYLYELGYRGNIYASEETLRQIPSFLKKWTDYVKKHQGVLPYDEENISRLSFKVFEDLPFVESTGRDGHVIGGLWYLLSIEGQRVLYTGDLTYDSLLLEADPLPEADVLLIDSAYAGKELDQKEQYEKLAETAQRTVSSGGKLLLPVPANGRGIDMFVYLSHFSVPLFAEKNIIQNTDEFFRQTNWIKPGFTLEGGYATVDEVNRVEFLRNCPGVYLFGDGMMTTAVAADYFEAVKNDVRSRIIISGHSSKGTLANQLLSPEYRAENAIRCEVERMTVKVHNDEKDVLGLVEQVQPRYVVLFHSDRSTCGSLIGELEKRHIAVLCDVGKTMDIIT